MFIEVYQIPAENWNKPAVESVSPENRRLIPLHAIRRVRVSTQCAGRAELQLSASKVIIVEGSYDEIVARITKASDTKMVVRV